jgi:hypothetical protein
MLSPPITQQQIANKLAEIGLSGRVIVPVREACGILHYSRAHYYASLIGELRHVRISERVCGTYASDIAQLLLRRELDPPPVRRRGRKKEVAE